MRGNRRIAAKLMRYGSKPSMPRTAEPMGLNIEAVLGRRMNRNKAPR